MDYRSRAMGRANRTKSGNGLVISSCGAGEGGGRGGKGSKNGRT